MGDLRFSAPLRRLRDAEDPREAVRGLTDNEVVDALAATSVDADPHYANIIASEAADRMRRARAALDHSGDGVVALDVDGRVTYANPTVVRVLGWTAEALEGRDFHGTVHDRRPDGTPFPAGECPIVGVLDEGGPADVAETTFWHRDGTAIAVEYSATPLVDEGGVNGAVVAFHDVTARKEAEQRLQESEQRYKSLFEHNPDAVYSLDAEGNFVSVNPAAERITGYRAEELEGHAFAPIIAEEDLDRVVDHYQRALAGEPQKVDVAVVRKDGTRISLAVVAFPMIVGGRVVGVHGIAKDVTAEKAAEVAQHDALVREREARSKLEKRVRERTRDLEASNEELESFSYSVSHDLRAPLRGIDVVSQALEEDYGGALDEEGRGYIARLREESRRMTHLVNDLLTLSRVTRGDVTREDVDLTALAHEIADNLRQSEPDRDVTFRIEDDLVAHADPRLIRVVLENMLGNAWKYTRKAEDAVIEFFSTTEDGTRVYHVRDNGIGFDPHQAKDLFTAFKRLHPSTEFEGTGVGLATVKRIIDRHEGRVWAEGEKGKGATFHFTV